MRKISRRKAIAAAGIGLGSSILSPRVQGQTNALYEEIFSLPTLSGHEHWGSIDAIGWVESGYVADLKMGVTTDNASIVDILFDPYSGMNLGSKGIDRNAEAREKGYENLKDWFRREHVSAWKCIQSILDGLRSTGWFSCLDEGFRVLYGTSLHELLNPSGGRLRTVVQVNQSVQQRYRNTAKWYREACRILGIERILRPVQLEFGFERENPEESETMSPLLRIDHFCSFYQKPTESMQYCVEKTGIDPKNADEFREFLSQCFAWADEAGFKGTKQLQAYSRPLNFKRPKDSEVSFASSSDPEKRLAFGNFVVYECAELAARRGWPHQIHVGTHNLPDSNPLPLESLIRAFPQVNFVLLHAWPFVEEAAYLAKSFSNVYIDPCWTPILNLGFFEKSMETYIGYLPDTKVTIGHDSTSVEMAAGSLTHSRAILADLLQKRIDLGYLTQDAALSLARAYFSENARRIYRV